MVPYRRDQSFVGRETIIETIKQRYKVSNQQQLHIRIALVGLGGVG
jgi:hypothetical protein